MFRLINEFKPEEIAVFGPTTGLNLLYASTADSRLPVRFFNENSSEIDITPFIKEYGLSNVDVIDGDKYSRFSDNRSVFTLVNYPFSAKKSLAVVNDFMIAAKNDSVILLRGIHSSKEMGEVWSDIKLNKKIRVSLELFDIGIGIVREKSQKENFVLRFKPFLPILRSLIT
jgi:hypothetical protein